MGRQTDRWTETADVGMGSRGINRHTTRRQADRETGRQADRETGRQGGRQTERQETGRQGDRQTGRQADREAGRQNTAVTYAETKTRMIRMATAMMETRHSSTAMPMVEPEMPWDLEDSEAGGGRREV